MDIGHAPTLSTDESEYIFGVAHGVPLIKLLPFRHVFA